MRALPLAARLRRQSRLLAAAPLLLAGALAGCIAGEPIASSAKGPLTGRYVLTVVSLGVDEDSLPTFVYRTSQGLDAYIQYATLDLYPDGTYAEVYQIDARDPISQEVKDTQWDVGNGKWSDVGGQIQFQATLVPSIFANITSWSGYAGGGGFYAFNVMRTENDPPFGMHYRRY